MLDSKELEELGVLDWSKLSKHFVVSDLLLGNGLSICIAGERFRYDSIFGNFLKRCSPKNRNIFEKFETHNFEFILEKLLYAVFVNRIFGIDAHRIKEMKETIQILKNGLIETIQEIHPRAEEIDKKRLESLGDKLAYFNDIYTLNYDLFIYRITLLLNDRHKRGDKITPYSDFFWNMYDEQFVCFGESEEYQGYKHPYYLHGALFIFPGTPYDLKLRREPSGLKELVKLIGDVIDSGIMPQFVSEGTYKDKLETINKSDYLRFTLKKLEEAKHCLVIYGTSLSDPDQHIVDAINKNDRDLAISIHVHAKKSKEEIRSEISRFKSKFEDYHTVYFFRSETLIN